jgi:glyoxylate/hydroxypyruvate reductase
MTLYIHTPLPDQLRATIRQQLTDNQLALFRDELPADERRAAFGQADIVMGNVPSAWFSEATPKLRWWQLDSAGFEQYRAVSLACPVTNMGDAYAWPCAETMVAGLLALSRQLPELVRQQAQSTWVGAVLRSRMTGLGHKRVVILGMGTIGRAVAGMLSGFRCTVRFMARTNPDADLHTVDDLKTALAETDIVVNTLPGTAVGFFSAELIGAMRPGSVFANVGRGNTVDEPALIDALRRGAIGGAVLDVTATEPLPADSPLWTLPTVLLTQHTGGGTADENQARVSVFLNNLARFQAGEPLQNQVDLRAGY